MKQLLLFMTCLFLGAISSCGFRLSFVPPAAHAATAEVKLLREQPMSSRPSSSFVAGCAISNFISKSVAPRKRVSGNWSCGIDCCFSFL